MHALRATRQAFPSKPRDEWGALSPSAPSGVRISVDPRPRTQYTGCDNVTMHTYAGIALACASALVCATRLASADASGDPDRASERFEQAKEDMARGDFASACPKLAESERLDPQVGTLLNLAYCYENAGKTATALSTWMEAAAFAARKNQRDREQFALVRARSLEPHVLRVTIRVAAQAAYDRIVLTLDGAPIERGRWGIPMAVDRGEHDLRAEAPGLTSFASHFSVDENHVPSLVVPALPAIEPSTEPRQAPVNPDLRGTRSSAEPRLPSAATSPGSRLLPYSVAAGSIGLAALTVGGGFGIAAIINATEAANNKNCAALPCTTHDSENTRATHDATAADASFAIAAAAGVTGLILFLASGTSGHARVGHVSIQPGGGPGLATVTLDGRW